jgi:hypothetical protein
MKNVAVALVLGTIAGLLACSSVPTRAKLESDEDSFCRAVARARVLEAKYGVLPDGGEAGAKP